MKYKWTIEYETNTGKLITVQFQYLVDVEEFLDFIERKNYLLVKFTCD